MLCFGFDVEQVLVQLLADRSVEIELDGAVRFYRLVLPNVHVPFLVFPLNEIGSAPPDADIGEVPPQCVLAVKQNHKVPHHLPQLWVGNLCRCFLVHVFHIFVQLARELA